MFARSATLISRSSKFTGIEVVLVHRTWPSIFATWSVINFPKFKFCPLILWTKNWKLFTSFLGFKVIYHEVEKMNPKDVYLPCIISNNNLCALLSAGQHFLVCSHPWKPQYAWFLVQTLIIIIGCFSFCMQTRWKAQKNSKETLSARVFLFCFLVIQKPFSNI